MRFIAGEFALSPFRPTSTRGDEVLDGLERIHAHFYMLLYAITHHPRDVAPVTSFVVTER
jgi:hypothetical protein